MSIPLCRHRGDGSSSPSFQESGRWRDLTCAPLNTKMPPEPSPHPPPVSKKKTYPRHPGEISAPGFSSPLHWGQALARRIPQPSWHLSPSQKAQSCLVHKQFFACFLTLQCGMRMWSSWFYPHFDGVPATCHKHWGHASPPSIWMGPEITTLLTGTKKAKYDNLQKHLSQQSGKDVPFTGSQAPHALAFGKAKQFQVRSLHYKVSWQEKNARADARRWHATQYFWDSHSGEDVLQDRVKKGSKLDREQRISHSHYFYWIPRCTLRPLVK